MLLFVRFGGMRFWPVFIPKVVAKHEYLSNRSQSLGSNKLHKASIDALRQCRDCAHRVDLQTLQFFALSQGMASWTESKYQESIQAWNMTHKANRSDQGRGSMSRTFLGHRRKSESQSRASSIIIKRRAVEASQQAERSNDCLFRIGILNSLDDHVQQPRCLSFCFSTLISPLFLNRFEDPKYSWLYK